MRFASATASWLRNNWPILLLALLVCSLQLACVRKTRSVGHESLFLSEPQKKNGSYKVTVDPKLNGLSASIRQTLKAQLDNRPRGKTGATNADMLEERDGTVASLLELSLQEPRQADPQFRLGKLYHHLKVYDRAYSSYRKAIQLSPENPSYYEAMGRLWRDWGNPRLGINDLQKALQLDPDHIDAWNSLGTIYDLLGQPAQAQAAYSKALAFKSDSAFVHNNLCYSYLQSGQIQAAIDHCRKAIEFDPELAVAYNNLGLAYGLAGDFSRALSEFRKVTDQSAAHNNLGVVLLKARRYQASMEQFKLAARLRPFYSQARKNFNLARKLQQESDRRAKRQAVTARPDSESWKESGWLRGALRPLHRLRVTQDLLPSVLAPLAVVAPATRSDPQPGISFEIARTIQLEQEAQILGSYLRNKGYRLTRLQHTPNGMGRTIVYYRPGFAERAVNLAHQIPGNQQVLRSRIDLGTTHVRITLGSDIRASLKRIR